LVFPGFGEVGLVDLGVSSLVDQKDIDDENDSLLWTHEQVRRKDVLRGGVRVSIGG
jgi:hypothetical protein